MLGIGVRYMHTKDTIYQYTQQQGIWAEIELKTLEQAVHNFIASCGVLPSSANVAEATSSVLRMVHRPDVQWGGVNPQNRILCANGIIINLDTQQTEAPSHDLYMRMDDRIAAKWDAGATAPMWTQAITSSLAHVPAAEQQRTIDMIEEWMGSALLRKDKPRRLSKCMIYVGDANTGKSTAIHALRVVLGEGVTSAADAGSMDGPHAGMPLIGKMAWLTDELPTRARMNMSLFKKLVTNEPVSINVKNKPFHEAKLNLTIGYATNSLPSIDDDGTNAVWDRMMIVPFHTVFDEQTEIPDLKEIITDQRDGILQVMVRALVRLRQRGQYDQPSFIRSYAEQVRQEENPMEEFIKAAFTETDSNCFVYSSDIASACRGFRAVVGDKEDARRFRFNGRMFDAHLRRSWPNVINDKEGHSNARVKRGLHFTQAGLSWLAEGQALENGVGVPTDAEKLKAANKRRLTII
jgi:P4 family phage/plasmid primase-like protien